MGCIYFETPCIYIYIYIVSWATVIEGDPKPPFSIVTARRCKGERNSFPWIAPLTLYLYLICWVLNKVASNTFFESFAWLDLGLNPSRRDHWWTLELLCQWAGTYVYILLYSHEQPYIYIYMQKHIQHSKDERTQFFRKIYLSLYWKGCVWEGVGDRTKTATYWPPTLLATTAFLSRSPGLLNRVPGDPASAGIWFLFQHLLSNWSELPVAGVV